MSNNNFWSSVDSLIRVGKVSSVDAEACTARVIFPDMDDVVSSELVLVVPFAVSDFDNVLPTVGAQVLCILSPVGSYEGFVLGQIYNRPVSGSGGLDG